MSHSILAPRETEQEPFAIAFGMKSAVEVIRDGVVGVLTRGMATLYNVKDQVGEWQVPGGFADVIDTWGRQAKPMVDYEHGMDKILGTAQIGWGVKYELTPEGLYVECFCPKDPTPPFQHNAAAKTKRWREIYQDILAGRTRGYSVMGVCTNVGKALVRWSMSSLTITPRPCLPEATFALGAKAVKSLLFDSPPEAEGDSPMMPAPGLSEATTGGVLSRPAFNTAMRMAQTHGDVALHDHLMSRPAHLQGAHDSQDCSICADRRSALGMKATAWEAKALLDAAARNQLADSDFAYIDADGGRHLPIHDAAHVRAAMARFDQTTFESEEAKAKAKAKILAAAKRFDIDASTFGGEETAPGKKAIEEARGVLLRFSQSAKAGRRFSGASKQTLQSVIDTLNKLIAEEQAEDEGVSA
jgi:hypothetical protein